MFTQSTQLPWQMWIIAGLFVVVTIFAVSIYFRNRQRKYLRNQSTRSVPINQKLVSTVTYVPKTPKTKKTVGGSTEPFTSRTGTNDPRINVMRSAYIYVPSSNSPVNTVLYEPITYTLRDYYVLTSYNSCIIGPYNNGVVSIRALANAIATGFRCLDFEIYSELGTDNPIVSCSTTMADDGTYPIQTGEPILFSDVLKYITTYAFVNYGCQNNTDPLILNLRIKTQNTNIPTKLAELFEKYPTFMVDPKYNIQNMNNFGTVPLPKLMNRISVFVSSITDQYLSNNKFTRFVNMYSTSGNLSIKRWIDFPQTGPVSDEMVLYNKQHITMVLPDAELANPMNRPITDFNKYGCQFVALVSNTESTGLANSLNFFNTNKNAFVLKPSQLRYAAPDIIPPKPQNPAYSYAPRTIQVPDNIPGVFKI